MRSPLRHPAPLYVVAIAALALLGTATRLDAQGGKKAPALVWAPAPTIFPPGARMAVESGDPMKSGEFVVRLQFPDGYKIPPHFHPTDEHVRVRSGTLLVGMGDKLDVATAKPLAAGDTGSIPAKMHHFAIAKGPTTISIRSEGPFAMIYVNPADTPKP